MKEEFYKTFVAHIPLFVFLETENIEYIREFHSMCMTYSHDYGMPGKPLDEIARIQIMVSPIFTHHVLPLLKKNEELVNGVCRCDRYYTFDERGC